MAKITASLLSDRDMAADASFLDRKGRPSEWAIRRLRNTDPTFPQRVWLTTKIARTPSELWKAWLANKPTADRQPSWDTPHHLEKARQVRQDNLAERRKVRPRPRLNRSATTSTNPSV
jgi:hypothetical protein